MRKRTTSLPRLPKHLISLIKKRVKRQMARPTMMEKLMTTRTMELKALRVQPKRRRREIVSESWLPVLFLILRIYYRKEEGWLWHRRIRQP